MNKKTLVVMGNGPSLKDIYISFDKDNIVWHNDDSYVEFDNLTLKKEHIKGIDSSILNTVCDSFKKTLSGLENRS